MTTPIKLTTEPIDILRGILGKYDLMVSLDLGASDRDSLRLNLWTEEGNIMLITSILGTIQQVLELTSATSMWVEDPLVSEACQKGYDLTQDNLNVCVRFFNALPSFDWA